MDIRVLRYFLMVAREENITNAAKALHITQPTLSRQMMELEKELNVSLFYRHKHHITLTPDGLRLRRRAMELVGLYDKTRQEFLQKDQDLEGNIFIGSGEFQVVSLLSDLFASFQKKHPKVCYRIYSNDSDMITLQLDQGILDLGVLMDPIDITKYNYIHLPVQEQWGILVRKDHPLASKKVIVPSDLISERILIPQREAIRSVLNNWFQGESKQPEIIGGANLQYNAAMLTRSGMGVLISLRLNCSYEDLAFIPMEPKIEQRTSLVWKKTVTPSILIEELLRHIRKELQNYHAF